MRYHMARSHVLHLLHDWHYIFLFTVESPLPIWFLSFQVSWVVRNATLKGKWKNCTDAIWRKKNGRTACVSFSRACQRWVALIQGWPWPRGHLDLVFIIYGNNICLFFLDQHQFLLVFDVWTRREVQGLVKLALKMFQVKI